MNAATAEFDATMAFATDDIAAGRIQPLFVLRHPKTGMWCLLPSVQVPTSAAEAMVTLGEVASRDPVLRTLIGLHAGQAARRSSASSPWRAVRLSQPVAVVAASSTAKSGQVGAGHDPLVQRMERRRARFASIASVWLTFPGIVLILVGILAGIGLDLGRYEPLGIGAVWLLAGALVMIGGWFLAFGLAAGSGARARWIALGALAPTLLGGMLAGRPGTGTRTALVGRPGMVGADQSRSHRAADHRGAGVDRGHRRGSVRPSPAPGRCRRTAAAIRRDGGKELTSEGQRAQKKKNLELAPSSLLRFLREALSPWEGRHLHRQAAKPAKVEKTRRC